LLRAAEAIAVVTQGIEQGRARGESAAEILAVRVKVVLRHTRSDDYAKVAREAMRLLHIEGNAERVDAVLGALGLPPLVRYRQRPRRPKKVRRVSRPKGPNLGRRLPCRYGRGAYAGRDQSARGGGEA